jgi:hypothetical protein
MDAIKELFTKLDFEAIFAQISSWFSENFSFGSEDGISFKAFFEKIAYYFQLLMSDPEELANIIGSGL